MTTVDRVEHLRKLLDSFVKNEISEEEFYSKLHELATHDPESIEKLREWVESMMVEENSS